MLPTQQSGKMHGLFCLKRCITAGRVYETQKKGTCPVANIKRKRFTKQLTVMAEVLRNRIQTVLLQATYITLSLDESKNRKVVRCRVPSRIAGSLWYHVGVSGLSQSGVLGLLACSKEHASDYEDDHVVTVVMQPDTFLTRCCAPFGRNEGKRGPHALACNFGHI